MTTPLATAAVLARDRRSSDVTEQHHGAVGRYIVIGPADDEPAHNCAFTVSGQLADPDRLRLLAIEDLVAFEDLVATARRLDDRRLHEWAIRFEARCL